jgi:CRP/FNR family transcriptional regulator, cyclic AMP receptor protein
VTKSADLNFLRQVILFRDIADSERDAIWSRLEERRLRRGEALFREGDSGTELFFIRSGSVIVSKHVAGRVEQVLARLGPGDFFGEMSLFDRQPRSATIQAEEDTVLFWLNRVNLDQLIEQNPRAATAFFTQLVLVFIKRLRDSSDLVAEVTRWGLEATGLNVDRPATGGH